VAGFDPGLVEALPISITTNKETVRMTRRELLFATVMATVTGSCRREPSSATVTLTVAGMV
jgi:hypothetical protein